MGTFPHAECPSIEGVFGDLVGLSVSRGYTNAVQTRFGRERGCSHIEFLARALGPVVIQAITSSAAMRLELGDGEQTIGGDGAVGMVDQHLSYLGRGRRRPAEGGHRLAPRYRRVPGAVAGRDPSAPGARDVDPGSGGLPSPMGSLTAGIPGGGHRPSGNDGSGDGWGRGSGNGTVVDVVDEGWDWDEAR